MFPYFPRRGSSMDWPTIATSGACRIPDEGLLSHVSTSFELHDDSTPKSLSDPTSAVIVQLAQGEDHAPPDLHVGITRRDLDSRRLIGEPELRGIDRIVPARREVREVGLASVGICAHRTIVRAIPIRDGIEPYAERP